MDNSWSALGASLDALAEELGEGCGDLLAMTLAQGFHLLSVADPAAPVWIPFMGSAVRSGAANPDTVFSFARIDGRHRYRITGVRGEVRFADILAQAGIVGLQPAPGPTVDVLDLADVPTDPDGRFTIVVSDEEPAEDGVYWWRLDPRVDQLWFRQVAYDWGTVRDAPLAIVRTDAAPPQRTPIALPDLAGFVRNYTLAWRDKVAGLRQLGLVNRLELVGLPDETGRVAQSYYQGVFELEPEHALLLEVPVPRQCRYWSVMLTDEHYTTVDWTRHQCSLNGAQAHVDTDGVFRAVISTVDPGYHNWLDTGGLRSGSILGRWNHAEDNPLPTLRSVPLAELAARLPADSPRVSAGERQRTLVRRLAQAQLRRRC